MASAGDEHSGMDDNDDEANMSSHLEHIRAHFGMSADAAVLDLGAGDGDFLMQCARFGVQAIGIEYADEKIARARQRAVREGVSIDIRQGVAEHVSLPDASFDFINASELIEHVANPSAVLSEIRRLLKADGACYMSVHNRYGYFDRHFKMRCLNWMPRRWAEKYLVMRGISKVDYDGRFGRQRISEMHYYTWSSFRRCALSHGLRATDLRESIVMKRFGRGAAFFYRICVRPWYFSTFHVKLTLER